MQNAIARISLMTLLSSTLLLSACNQKNAENSNEITPEDQVMQEMSSELIKEFAKTAEDTHDIKLLIDYDSRYTAMTDDMEDELSQMQKNGTLTAEFAYTRKRDNILSALDMLKQLDLKTQQGRYIQGLLANYWETQSKWIESHKAEANKGTQVTDDTLTSVKDFLQAQEQLEYWRNQYPELDSQK